MSAPASHARFAPVPIVVTNYKGVTGERQITPAQIQFRAFPPYHLEPAWLLQAFDHGRGAYRWFDLAGLHAWGRPAVNTAQLARDGVQLSAELLDAIERAVDHLLGCREQAALEVLSDAVASARPPAALGTDGGAA